MSPEDFAERQRKAEELRSKVEQTLLPTDTKYRAATFIETYTGRAFWPLMPTKDSISIIDIAHALSNQCRYTGHVKHFYSVSQHCILLAQWLEARGGSPLDCLQILMHDAPEAYLVDIARPVKQYMPEYRVWDHAINDVIREWMDWGHLPMPKIQDDLDSRIIVDERAQLMSDSGNDWGHDLQPVGVRIERMSPDWCEATFLDLYEKYSRQVYGRRMYDSNVRVKMDTGEVRYAYQADYRGKVIKGTDGRWLHKPFEFMEEGAQ